MIESLPATIFGLGMAMFGPIVIAIASKRTAQSPNRHGPRLLGQAALAAIVAIVLAIVFCVERKPASSIGLGSPGMQSVAWGLALVVFLRYAYFPLMYRALSRFRSAGFEKGLAQLQALPAWYLVIAVCVGGVAEEILYRGYAIERIATLTDSIWIGGIVPVVVFSLAHVPIWGWSAAVSTLVPGAIFTLFYLWQRDLAACIVAHVVTDFMGIVVAPRMARRRAP